MFERIFVNSWKNPSQDPQNNPEKNPLEDAQKNPKHEYASTVKTGTERPERSEASEASEAPPLSQTWVRT